MLNLKQSVSPDENDSAWIAERMFTGCAAVLGLGASLWSAPDIGSCGACLGTSQLLPEIPLAWIGATFYSLLATAVVARRNPRWIALGFFTALGVHTVFLALLVREQISCTAWMVAGGAAFLGAFVSLAGRPQLRAWIPAGAFIAAAMATVCGIGVEHLFHSQREARQLSLTDTAPPATVAAGRVKLVLYERDGCKHCLDFEENVMRPLQQALGDKMDVERREPAIDMETPTVIVEGLFYFVPVSEALGARESYASISVSSVCA